ncbi:hypothetical protein [Aminobacter sp. LjRoot7]|uniref:hypothetical protein n=1 Tax=Aminobacter sp. LjRoot7 TaxID=3342335 RepID=UPI003ECFBF3C
MGDGKPAEGKKPWNWLWVSLVASAVYVGGLVIWTAYDDLGLRVSDNHLNEVGDFLAGVFAPLAVFWLIAAVLTQRQELTEAREQFTESQAITRKQMEFITAQNNLLHIQHQQAEESAKRSYRLSLFERRFHIYEELRDFGKKYSNSDYGHKSYSEFDTIRNKASFVFSTDIENWLDEVADTIDRYVRLITRHRKETGKLDIYGTLNVPPDEKIDGELKGMNDWIAEELTLTSLRERLWSSMRVSDN